MIESVKDLQADRGDLGDQEDRQLHWYPVIWRDESTSQIYIKETSETSVLLWGLNDEWNGKARIQWWMCNEYRCTVRFLQTGIESLYFSHQEEAKRCTCVVSLHPAVHNLPAQFCQEIKSDDMRPIFRPWIRNGKLSEKFWSLLCSDKREHYNFIRPNLQILNPSHRLKSLSQGRTRDTAGQNPIFTHCAMFI